MSRFDTTPEGILRLAGQGESVSVEFKVRLPPADIVGRVLASFANTDGGIVLIGVEDNGDVVGIPDENVSDVIDRLQRVSSSMLPQPTEIGCTNVGGKSVVYAVVDPSPQHFRPVLSSRGEVYARNGAATVMVSGSTLKGVLRSAIGRVETIPERTKGGGKPMVCFVAMSFREEEDPALADYFAAMKRAVSATGLEIVLRRVDLVEGDFEISQQIMNEIDNADAVLADFTLSSRNVYFELGYARGTRRRVIQTARKGTNLEFDIRNWRTVIYRNATELEERLESELRKAFHEWSSDPDEGCSGG